MESSNTIPGLKAYVLVGPKYEPVLVDNAYKVLMKLTIHAVTMTDYGAYRCVSKNSLGETDGSIKLYRKSRNMGYPRPPSCIRINI